ncbi:glycosyltransferase family 4 protein [Mucilaginibacter sp.]|uniref:glycosyltransferase family 4 protein n=1 Tax=Mucilaginibacter sp. TaxID=1882438 RepID=UPI0025D8D1AA|nr:glycosyltransferase family 4 protein [Mucilaginibacter sp.]
MKILIVITRGDSIGGAQTHVITLSKLLQRHGHDVLICYGGELAGPLNQLIVAAGLNSVTVPSLCREISLINDIKAIFQLRKVANRFKPDVISLHSSKTGIVGRLSNLFSGRPVVFTVHGWAFTEGVNRTGAVLYKLIEKALAGLAAKIIVVSDYDKKIALKNNVSNSRTIERVYNGVDVGTYGKDFSGAKGTVDIVMVARFDDQKDHETLILACNDIDNIKVHLLGDGPKFEKTVGLVNDLKIGDKFIFYGYSNSVEEVLKKADIFVLISNWEGFPISTLEALKYSLPVIVSDVGGAGEAIIDGETGYSVKRKDVADLKSKLVKLINDPVLRQTMGLAGNRLLLQQFSSEAMYKNTLEVFESAILKKSSN